MSLFIAPWFVAIGLVALGLNAIGLFWHKLSLVHFDRTIRCCSLIGLLCF